MKILAQVGILFGVCWVSQCIEKILPFFFPASVIGLILVLALLGSGVLRVDHIREKSDFLLGNLPFFFIPSAVGIIQYVDLLWDNAAAFLTVCVVTIIVTFAATVWAVQLTVRLLRRREERRHAG